MLNGNLGEPAYTAAVLFLADAIELAAARLLAMSAIEIFNAAAALVAALVALGACNRMNKRTELTIIFAFSTVGAGLLGFCFGSIMPERWQAPIETILIGGVGALLVGTRRQTIWIPPIWMPRISYAMTLATWVAFFMGI